MTITSYPFDGTSTTEAQYGKLLRELGDGVCGSPSSTALQVSSSTGAMDVKVSPGFAIVRGHAVNITAAETLTVESAGSSQRIDLLVLRLDISANTILPVIVKGGSSAPSPTQTEAGIFELPLATITVPASAISISNANIADRRLFHLSSVQGWGSTSRPSEPRTGQVGWNTDSAIHEFWDGGKWASLISAQSASDLSKGTLPTGRLPAIPVANLPVVPVNRGGTGATTAAAGLAALGGLPLGGNASYGFSCSWINASGNIDAGGVVHGASAAFSGTLSAGSNAVIGGTLRAGSSTILGNLEVSGSASTGNLTVAGDVTTAGEARIQGRGTSTASSNVRFTSTGFLREIVSLRAHKALIEDLHLSPDAVLNLEPRSWFDKAELRDAGLDPDEATEDEAISAGLARVPGFVAEEVADTAPILADIDDKGNLQGVRYDRVAAALLLVIKDQERRIATLEERVA